MSWTWWFIGRDDEAPHMPLEEEGDRPYLDFEADLDELVSLGLVLDAPYEPAVVFQVDRDTSIARVPDAFVRALAHVADVSATARAWQPARASLRKRELASIEATLTEMRAFAAEAARGAGIVVCQDD